LRIIRYNNKLLITFDYNLKFLEIIQSFPNRYWHKKVLTWELSIEDFQSLINKLDESEYPYEIIDKTIEFKPFHSYEFKTEPMSHQQEGFEFGSINLNWFLGDEQGLGKTKQVLDLAVAKKENYRYKHCLIVTGVRNIRINWLREIKKHTKEPACIIGGKKDSNQSKLIHLQQIPEEYFWIINGEALRNSKISDLLKIYTKKGIISILLVDEIHRLKNPVTQQGKGLLKLKECKEKILLSGTPIENSPLDGFMILKLLEFEKRTWTNFKGYYCEYGGFGGFQVLGYNNMKEYRNRFKSIMLRRLKEDVLDLPEKIRTTEYLKMNPLQRLVYEQVRINILNNLNKIKKSKNPLVHLLRLRQATLHTALLSSEYNESIKFERVLDLIENSNSNNRKCVVFSQSRVIIELLYKELALYNPAIITGAVKNTQQEIDKFQLSDKCRVILGTSKALGTGYNLTAGTHMIRLDRAWTPSTCNQEEDRLHRIGTTQTINITTLVCIDTIDEKIEQLIERKGSMSDYLIDGRIMKDKEKLLDWILS